MSKPGWFILIILCTAVAGWAIYRSLQIESQYTADLRNRIVGARLQQDHAAPYFYRWRPGDPIRYYDPCNIAVADSNIAVSNITATPFLHHLLEPIAGWPQRTISRIWLVIEWLVFAACIGMALSIAGSRLQKALVLAVGATFLLTEAWRSHIATGQYYLLVPFLALLFYQCFRKAGEPLSAATAGLVAIVLVMIRPNSIVFFLPFLFVIGKFPARSIALFFIPVTLLTGLTLTSPRERAFWSDYKKAMIEDIRLHQSLDVNALPSHSGGYYSSWEGWHQADIEKSYAAHPYNAHSEHGNVFVLFAKVTQSRLSLAVLNGSALLLMVLLTGYFMWQRKTRGHADLHTIAIFGYCLYMISDLFSPIWRFQYNTLQWLFPVLLAAAYYRLEQRKWFVWLGLALLLNILNIPFMKMEHTIGEYMMLIVLLALSYSRPPHPAVPGGPLQRPSNSKDHSDR